MSRNTWAVFEDDLSTVDWGIKMARQRKQATPMQHTAWLMGVFNFAVIILPARSAVIRGSRRLQEIAVDIERSAYCAEPPGEI
jgi:hypothetical protein